MKTPTIGCYIDGANQPQIEGDVRTVRLTEDFGRLLDRETRNFCWRVELKVATERDYEMSDDFSLEAKESYEITVVLAERAGAPVTHQPQELCP